MFSETNVLREQRFVSEHVESTEVSTKRVTESCFQKQLFEENRGLYLNMLRVQRFDSKRVAESCFQKQLLKENRGPVK